MAPEIVSKLGYSYQCDVWSIGIMMFLLLFKYDKDVEANMVRMIQSGNIEFNADLWTRVSTGGI